MIVQGKQVNFVFSNQWRVTFFHLCYFVCLCVVFFFFFFAIFNAASGYFTTAKVTFSLKTKHVMVKIKKREISQAFGSTESRVVFSS